MQLAPECRQLIAEIVEDEIPRHRDMVGAIDKASVFTATVDRIARDHPAMDRRLEAEGRAHIIETMMNDHLRKSAHPYAVKDRQDRTIATKAKFLRAYIHVPNGARTFVLKRRMDLTRADMRQVVGYYQGVKDSAGEEIAWYQDVEARMEQLGLPETATVASVVAEVG